MVQHVMPRLSLIQLRHALDTHLLILLHRDFPLDCPALTVMEVGIALAVGQISAKLLSIIWTYYSDVKDAKKDIVSLVHELEDLRPITNKTKEMTDTNSSKLHQRWSSLSRE